jgi:hypothetical protein
MNNNVSTVGFYLQTPFHYYLYETIINELVQKKVKCHLLLNDAIYCNNEWSEMYLGLVKFIEKLDRGDIDAFLISTVREIGYIHDCIVSPYFTNELNGLGRKNVRLIYGLAKDDWNYSRWNIFYDKILCYGDYDYKKLNIYNNCRIIGNPRFDNWFNNKLPGKNEIVKQYRLKFENNRETILYAPTYGELSSIDKWTEKIEELGENFNLIIKIHHGTAYLKSEMRRKKLLYRKFENVFDDSVNLLHLLKLSDYVLSDYSGVIFDALLAQKKVVLLNVNSALSINNNSLEIKVRNLVPNINEGNNIKKIFQDTGLFERQKKDLLNLSYNSSFGHDK